MQVQKDQELEQMLACHGSIQEQVLERTLVKQKLARSVFVLESNLVQGSEMVFLR